MTVRPAVAPLRLPRTQGAVPKASEFDSAMQMIERADVQSLKSGTTPTLPALILLAEDGSSWRLLVAPDGTLQTSAVPR